MLTTLLIIMVTIIVLSVGLVMGAMRSRKIQGWVLYLNWLNILSPKILDMERLKPTKETKNLKLKTEDGETLGAWLIQNPKKDQIRQEKSVIVYFHGNAASRRHFRRNKTYLLLLEIFGAEALLTIDYRGFAESSGHPTEQGLILDAFAAYRYGLTHYNSIYIWGHS